MILLHSWGIFIAIYPDQGRHGGIDRRVDIDMYPRRVQ